MRMLYGCSENILPHIYIYIFWMCVSESESERERFWLWGLINFILLKSKASFIRSKTRAWIHSLYHCFSSAVECTRNEKSMIPYHSCMCTSWLTSGLSLTHVIMLFITCINYLQILGFTNFRDVKHTCLSNKLFHPFWLRSVR